MYQSLITLRYAKALFLQAEEQGVSDQVLADVQELQQAFDAYPDILRTIEHPVIQTSKKKCIFSELFQERISALTLKFIHLVLKNRREAYLINIFRNFRDIYNEDREIKKVELTTALPLEAGEKEVIKKLIRQSFHARKVDFNERIDSEIVGGFIIQIEDQLLDASVRRQLQMIRKTLSDKNAIVS